MGRVLHVRFVSRLRSRREPGLTCEHALGFEPYFLGSLSYSLRSILLIRRRNLRRMPGDLLKGELTVHGCMCQATSNVLSTTFLNATVFPKKLRTNCQPGSAALNSAKTATLRICASSSNIKPPRFNLSAVKNQSTIGHGNACFPSSSTRSRLDTSLQRGRYSSDGSEMNLTPASAMSLSLAYWRMRRISVSDGVMAIC
jgi:hypothetical protein